MYNGMGEDNKKRKYIVGEIHAIIEYSTMTGVGLYQIPIMWKYVIIVESTRWSALYNVTCAIISLNDCLFRATKRSVSRSFRLRRRMDVALANSLSITTGRVMRGRPSQQPAPILSLEIRCHAHLCWSCFRDLGLRPVML